MPNRTYRLKLVIADEGDKKQDAAVFINNDMDLGGDLGLDKKNDVLEPFGFNDPNTDVWTEGVPALCVGDDLTLDTKFNGITHKWYKNGVEISSKY